MTGADPIRIAMWSGPRNISTAMMRSFGARTDTAVIDEPFYAAYLAGSGSQHPMRETVLASQPNDWRQANFLSEAHDPPHAQRFWPRVDALDAQCVPDP